MWTKLISAALTWWRGRTPSMTWLAILLAVLMLGALALTGWMRMALVSERAAHATTRAALALSRNATLQAWAEAARWREGTILAQRSASALQMQVQAAQTREAEAVRAVATRRTIMMHAKPRPATTAELLEVVDNATRNRICDYLNRPLLP